MAGRRSILLPTFVGVCTCILLLFCIQQADARQPVIPPPPPPVPISPGTYCLKGDNGKYLSLCNGCGYPLNDHYTSASVEGTLEDQNSVWKFTKVGEKYSIQGNNENYLERSEGSWRDADKKSSAAFVDEPNTGESFPQTLWTAKRLINGKWTFMADNGKYMHLCYGCGTGSVQWNFAFVDLADPDDPRAQWELIPVEEKIPPGRYSLKGSNGKYLNLCMSCGDTVKKNDSSSVSASVEGLYEGPESTWKFSKVGDKYSIQGNNGKYLGKCLRCWFVTNPEHDNAVFVKDSSADSHTLWTAKKMSNGKWTFMADNGMYMTICHDCVRESTYSDFAFVLSVNPDDSRAQWELMPFEEISPGKYYLKGDDGKYMNVFWNSNVVPDVNKASFPVSVEGSWWKGYTDSVWTIAKVGDKYSIQAEIGKYLNGCERCTTEPASYANVVYARPKSTYQLPPEALWTAKKMRNGKWSFKASNGMYMRRCYGCLKQIPSRNYVTFSKNPARPETQWELTLA